MPPQSFRKHAAPLRLRSREAGLRLSVPADWPGLQEGGGGTRRVCYCRRGPGRLRGRRSGEAACEPRGRRVAPGRLVGVGRGWKTGLPLAPAGLRAAVPRACRAAVPPSRWRPSPEPRRPLRALSFPLFCRFAGGVVMAQRAFPNPYADYNKSLAECYFDSTGRVS